MVTSFEEFVYFVLGVDGFGALPPQLVLFQPGHHLFDEILLEALPAVERVGPGHVDVFLLEVENHQDYLHDL